MSRTAWAWAVVVLTTVALAATFLVTPRFPVPVPESGPPATPFGWSGQLSLVAGDGMRGLRDGTGAVELMRELDVVVFGTKDALYRMKPDGTELREVAKLARPVTKILAVQTWGK